MRHNLLLVALLGMQLHATTITELFDAVSEQPSAKVDAFGAKMGELGVKKVESNYALKADAFATATLYSDPTNLLPVDPIKAGELARNNEAMPFAKDIEKIGVKLSMPLYVAELDNLVQKSKHLAQSAKLKHQLNIFKNEAVVLGSDATLIYLENLLKAMQTRKSSLKTTRNILEVGVQSGGMAGIALDKIDEGINKLDISINNIELKRSQVIAQIESLTNMELKESAPLNVANELNQEQIFALEPLHALVLASQEDLKASKAKRYSPKVALSAMWSENYTTSDVSKSSSLSEDYGFVQVGVSLPLYDTTADSDIELKKVQIMKDKMKLEKTKQELMSQAKDLSRQLGLLEKSAQLTQNNVEKEEKLLAYAKVAFGQGSMTQEDYLQYENSLLATQANYYQVLSQKWQVIGKLAVIYGNDLKGVVQ